VTPQVEGPLASLHGGGRGRPKDTIDRPHCCWSVKLLAATPALKIKGWRGEQTGRQAGKQQVGRGQSLALGDARGVCGIYPACEELLHVYPATQREALAAERGRWPMRQCLTGRTRILLPPASWRRAQLRGHLRITANQHRHLRRTRARAIESVLSKDVQGTRDGSLAVPFCQYFEKSQAKILKIAFCSKGLLL